MMSDGHCFISYSNGDADGFGPQLANELEGGNPFIETWYDKRDIPAGATWDEIVPEAIKTCKCFIFVMTKDSIAENTICADEWDLALRYKKPILILQLDKDIKEAPFRLAKRQWIDFVENPKAGLAKLRRAIQLLDLSENYITEKKQTESQQKNIDDPKYEITKKEADRRPIKVFICYRRADSIDITGRIYDRLSDTFGKESVFKDVDSIPLGKDYREVLRESVSQCSIFLVVIGKYWLKTENGEQRLNMPRDFVRFEIETALQRRIPVIPLLVNGASLPVASDIPHDLLELIYRHGMPIRPDPDFHTDINRLIRHINSISRKGKSFQNAKEFENNVATDNKNTLKPKRKTKNPKSLSDEKIKHLEIIQRNINELSNSSKQMKVIMLITVSILLLVFTLFKSNIFILVALLPTIIFWMLDAYYVQQQRKFRGLYNDVAGVSGSPQKIAPFAMPIQLYHDGKYSFWDVFVSPTILTLYATMVMIILVIYFLF